MEEVSLFMTKPEKHHFPCILFTGGSHEGPPKFKREEKRSRHAAFFSSMQSQRPVKFQREGK